MSLITRLEAETPKWFKRIIKVGLVIASAGTTLLSAEQLVKGFVLSASIHNAAQWMIVAGLVATAVSKTAKEDCSNSDSSSIK